MKNWYYAKDIGQLYIEKVLVHGDEPVLFVCVDDKNQRYLCMAYQPERLRFVMSKVSTDQLLDMLEKKISIDQTFRRSKEIYTTEENEDLDRDVDLILTANDSKSFPADRLPKAGAYCNLNLPWVKDYIARLQKEQADADIDESSSNKPSSKRPLKRFLPITFLILLPVILFVVVLAVGHHSLVVQRADVADKQEAMEVALTKRADHAAALSSAVKLAAGHETSTFARVSNARDRLTEAIQSHDVAAESTAESELNDAVRELQFFAGTYPSLLVSKDYKKLLVDDENAAGTVVLSARDFDESVLVYNNALCTFPTNLAGLAFRCEPVSTFEQSRR